MTMLYHAPGAVDPILFGTSVAVELEPVYQTIPAIKPRRSASEMRCAALMLEKLRRQEDTLPDDFHDAIAKPYDGDRVMDSVVESLMQVL